MENKEIPPNLLTGSQRGGLGQVEQATEQLLPLEGDVEGERELGRERIGRAAVQLHDPVADVEVVARGEALGRRHF